MNSEEFEKTVRAQLEVAGPGAALSTVSGPRAHRIVMRSARKFCEELYQVYARKMPGFYAAFPSENDFAKRFWPHFIGVARATLARSLESNLSDDLKNEIYDALIRDQSLAASRRHVPQIKMDL